jgi:hypothetical protein
MRLRTLTVAAAFAAMSIGVAAESRNLLLLDSAHLEGVAARLRGQPEVALAQALAELEKDAQQALALKPLSVMDKAVTPPSGDKHDYMSQAPYWWPDPSKPNGRPYIRKDGQRNPEISQISDHESFDRVMAAVSTLGLAFRLTGKTDYAQHVNRLVRMWFLDPSTRMNPHLKYGQGIPGITEGRGIGIIETRALPQLLDGVTLTSSSSEWTEADVEGLRTWMRAYLAWLVESEHGKAESKNGNNHETWYDVQVASLALFVGDTALARRTLERSRQRIGTQIEVDGRQPRELERTRAWDYSIFNLRAFFDLARLGESIGVDLWNHRTADGRSLRQAVDFLVPFATGDRAWPYDQITAFRPSELAPVVRRAAAAWKEPKYRALADRLGKPSARDLLTTP